MFSRPPIEFQNASSGYRDPFSGTTWSNNPIYQSPESANVSWASQVDHWNAPTEGVETLTPRSAEVFSSFGDDSTTVANSIRSLWNQNEKIGQQLTEEAPITSEISAPNISPSDSELSTEVTAGEELVEDSETAVEATETGLEVAEGSTGVGLLAILNQQLGMATTSAMEASQNQQVTADFQHNAVQQGMGASLQASMIRDQEQNNVSKTAAISSIGSILGPLGSLAGQAIGQSIYQPSNPYDLNTANSFNGMFNPQDTGVVQSLNTDMATGDTQQVQNV
ncbi:MAG: hypothetical protein [Apis polycipivirus]|nr:MAG: hypothetical protein [Apis polycipivirus]